MDSIWHPYTRFSAFADGALPVIVRGEGIYLYDGHGVRYVDAISSWWACVLGHGHPRVIAAIKKQADTLQHSILGNLSHPMALELAGRLSRLCGGQRRVHFASDGASAIEIALKTAVQYWDNIGVLNRHAFLSISGAYHGDTLGAVSVGYVEQFHRPFRSMLFRTYRVPAPACRPCDYGQAGERCTTPCFSSTEQAVRAHADELAAVVVEPLCQGAAGMRMHGPDYLSRLAALCKDTNILLIVDEIATGFCKTGKMFAFEHAGIDPDIVCVGKALSAGYLPISAAIVKNAVYDTFSDAPDDHTFYHGHTFSGNPLAAAASVAALSVYEDEAMSDRAQAMGDLWRRELKPLEARASVREVRVLGAIAAIEFSPGSEGRDGLPVVRSVQRRLLAEGILVRPLGDVLYLIPPLVTDDSTLCDLSGALVSAVEG